MTDKNKKKSLIVLLVLAAIAIQFYANNSFAQLFDSVNEKYKNKDYMGAENELKDIIKSDPDNIKAHKLLGKIVKIRKREKSAQLTERALLEIDRRNFKSAGKFLERAISLDPTNSRARELYLSIEEVSRLEKKIIKDKKNRELEEKLAAKEAKEKKGIISKRTKYFFNTSFLYTFAESDNLSYINSDISMIGLRLEGIYYPDFMKRRLGVSADYTGNLFKITGDENIDFLTHRLNASVRFRSFFFEDSNSALIAGVRLNYHYFYLQNLKDSGVYNFTNIYGPSLGFFISDPVIYRFYKKEFLKSAGFEGEVNYLYMIGKGSAPSILEFYIGVYYNYNRFRFGAGYRSYRLENKNNKESYNDIGLSVGYLF